jgi:hypothetical protein
MCREPNRREYVGSASVKTRRERFGCPWQKKRTATLLRQREKRAGPNQVPQCVTFWSGVLPWSSWPSSSSISCSSGLNSSGYRSHNRGGSQDCVVRRPSTARNRFTVSATQRRKLVASGSGVVTRTQEIRSLIPRCHGRQGCVDRIIHAMESKRDRCVARLTSFVSSFADTGLFLCFGADAWRVRHQRPFHGGI